MPYTLTIIGKRGPYTGPSYRYFTDALADAVTAVRNGMSYVQEIRNSAGELEHRVEPFGPLRKQALPVVVESGSVVTPGLCAMGGTFGSFSGSGEGAGLSLMDETFELADGV